MKIIDAHAHTFNDIKGERRGKKIKSLGNGKIQLGEEIQQILPESFATNSFSVYDLIRIMDENEVEHAVLLQNPVFGLINDEIEIALEQFPNRFRGTIQVDPYTDDACKVIEHYASVLQNTVKFELSEGWGWSGKYPKLSIVDDSFLKLWERIAQLKLNVIIDPGEIDNNGYQLENIEKIAREFPEINILIEHFGYLTEEKSKATEFLDRWKSMIKLGKICKNVSFGISAFPTLMKEKYPFSLLCSLLQEVIDIISADKLLWGSDIPTTLGQYSYQQLKNLIIRHCPHIDDLAKSKIMGINAYKFFNF